LKTPPLPYGLRNPYRNLKFKNSQDYVQKPQRNCTLMNSASEPMLAVLKICQNSQYRTDMEGSVCDIVGNVTLCTTQSIKWFTYPGLYNNRKNKYDI
jgi:hypothetical protein